MGYPNSPQIQYKRVLPLLRERGLPGLLSLRELEEVWELQKEPSSSSELDESSELDD